MNNILNHLIYRLLEVDKRKIQHLVHEMIFWIFLLKIEEDGHSVHHGESFDKNWAQRNICMNFFEKLRYRIKARHLMKDIMFSVL